MTRKVVRNKGRFVFSLIIICSIIFAVVLFVININKKEDIKIKEESSTGTGQNKVNEVLNHAILLEDGTKVNTSEEMKLIKKYKELEISNIQFTSKSGSSVLLADVKNLGQEKHETEIIKITILGDNNEVITEIAPIIGEVNPGETIKLNAIVTADIVDAKDIKIEEKK